MKHSNTINWKKFFTQNIVLNLAGVLIITLAIKGFMILISFRWRCNWNCDFAMRLHTSRSEYL
jgi:hypothetical protein